MQIRKNDEKLGVFNRDNENHPRNYARNSAQLLQQQYTSPVNLLVFAAQIAYLYLGYAILANHPTNESAQCLNIPDHDHECGLRGRFTSFLQLFTVAFSVNVAGIAYQIYNWYLWKALKKENNGGLPTKCQYEELMLTKLGISSERTQERATRMLDDVTDVVPIGTMDAISRSAKCFKVAFVSSLAYFGMLAYFICCRFLGLVHRRTEPGL